MRFIIRKICHLFKINNVLFFFNQRGIKGGSRSLRMWTPQLEKYHISTFSKVLLVLFLIKNRINLCWRDDNLWFKRLLAELLFRQILTRHYSVLCRNMRSAQLDVNMCQHTRMSVRWSLHEVQQRALAQRSNYWFPLSPILPRFRGILLSISWPDSSIHCHQRG